MLDPRDYVEVDEVTDEHVGREAAIKFVNYEWESPPTYGILKRHFSPETGEPDGVSLVSEYRHHMLNAIFPQEDTPLTSDTTYRYFVNLKVSPDA